MSEKTMTPADIRPEFQVHKLNEQGAAKARAVAYAFTVLLEGIEEMGVKDRRLALVRTHLENACFQAKKGIAEQPENQE